MRPRPEGVYEIISGHRRKYAADILKCLDQKPADFEELLKLLQAEGYEIKRGKHTAICGKEQKRFIRFRSLGDDFSEEHLKKVIAGEAELPENKTESREPKQPPRENGSLILWLIFRKRWRRERTADMFDGQRNIM